MNADVKKLYEELSDLFNVVSGSLANIVEAIDDAQKHIDDCLDEAEDDVEEVEELDNDNNDEEEAPELPFNVGQQVQCVGTFRGNGAVLAVWDDQGQRKGEAEDKWNRPDQPYPQVEVLCEDGKKRHYNGDDIKRGIVRVP